MSKFDGKMEGLLNAQDLKKLRFRLLYWVFFICLILVSIGCLAPAVWIFLSGFKDTQELYAMPPTLLPKAIRFSKIKDVWSMLNFSKYYMNSIFMLLGEWSFCIVFNGLAGYVLSRIRPKGSALVSTIVFWAMLLPTSVNMVPLFMSFVDVPLLHINITDSYMPMWLMAGANAFYILLFRSFFDDIPMSYIEAARINGCSALGIFTKIMLPLSKPIIMVVSIFTVTASWGSFLWPYLILKTPTAFPITVKVFELKRSGITTDNYMLVLLLTIIPPTVFYAFFSKKIMGGMDMSGIKG